MFLRAATGGTVGYVNSLLKAFGVAAALAPDQVCDAEHGFTMMHLACLHDHPPLLGYLCRNLPMLMTMRDHEGLTPLDMAVALDRVDAVGMLASRDMSSCSTSMRGESARFLLPHG